MIVLESFSEYLQKIVGAAEAADGAAVSTRTLLQRFLPLGYRAWTGDLLEEITDALLPESGAQQASAEELDDAGQKRGCSLYILHHGPPPLGEWHTGLGCLKH